MCGERLPRTRRWRSAARRHGYTDPNAPVAQGIERCPAEAEVACSNHAGRMAQPRAFGGVDAPESELVAPACSTSLEVDDGRSLRGRRRAVGLKATFETRLWAALAAWVP